MGAALWHIEISHFSEKVRWALRVKGVEHERRAPPPGLHMPVALWLTRGRSGTLPILELDGERFGDSTTIIAALTAASLLYPLVWPEQGPKLVQEMPERYERLRASLSSRRGYRWVEEVFATHRT